MRVYKHTIVIGWDGADIHLTGRFLKEGKLPNLAHLIESGGLARLESTIRPESSTAWTSFATGLPPQDHGVFAFKHIVPGHYQTCLNTTAHVHAPYFWETLSQVGKRVGLLNMPMAYPPRPVNGFLVCGLMTPGLTSNFTYPAQMRAELLGRQGGYTVDAPAPLSNNRQHGISMLNQLVEQRTQVGIELLRQEPWDLFSVIFTELDRVQHYYWADMDPMHPLRLSNPIPDAIASHYKCLDASLGALMANAHADTLVLVVSDHGFGSCSRSFYVNNWLAKMGYLRWKPASRKAWAVNQIKRLGLLLRKSAWLRKLRHLLVPRARFMESFDSYSFYQQVDWQHTRAFFSDAWGIQVNLEGREPQGVVKQSEYADLVTKIATQIGSYVDPGTDEKVIENVYRKGELYAGQYLNQCPDLILMPTAGDDQRHGVWIRFHNARSHDTVVEGSAPYTGYHTMNGIIASNDHELVGLANGIPSLADIVLKAQGVNITASPVIAKGYGDESEEKDEETIQDRLKQLGYLE